VKRVVFTSTLSALRARRGPYGQTKLEAEVVVRQSGLPFVILRPSLVYGAHGIVVLGSTGAIGSFSEDERKSLAQIAAKHVDGRLPLLVGTWAPRLAAFAGEEAQELKVGGSANPDVVPVLRERIANPDVDIVLGAVTVVDDDGARARRIARREVAMYLAVVAELDPTVEVDPELIARVREHVDADDHDAAGSLIPDDLLDRFSFAGTPDEVADHAEAVFAAGARRVDFGTPHGAPERRGVELLCTGVLPRLRVAV
jgi:alkanesulfonate monooxygenase SsuD/methylene tetrahydromethanopterin reductase-like flavin-dependent oxidoreductase (luciferase family)